jgi:hypothetical protein
VFEAHPIAAVFPLLGEDELLELAGDISRTGLLEPIVLFEGLVLDGRNRLRACELAAVEPRFEEYTGSDPFSYVVSCNLHRRHLSVEERKAIAKELILRDPSRTDTAVSQQSKLSYVTTLKMRREVERECPAVAQATRFAKDGRRTQGRPRGSQPRRPLRWIETLDRHFAEDAGNAAEVVVQVIVSYDAVIRERLPVARRHEMALQFCRALGVEQIVAELAA